MALRLGQMRERVTFQARSSAQDATGAPANTWTDVCTVWAERMPQGAREFFASQTRGAEVETLFRLRARTDIVPRMRALWAGKVFDVTGVIHQGGMSDEMVVVTSELVEVSP